MKKMNSIPVYSFIGYRNLESHYHHKNDGEVEEFGIKVEDSTFENDIHVMTLLFHLKYVGEEMSTFVFNAGFAINDLDWYDQVPKSNLNSIFLAVVFPYIRQKIQSFTDDYRGCVNIPTIDLRNVDLSKGITFKRN